MESSHTASLQSLFNQIAAGESIFIQFANKKEYDSMRVMLLRKFAGHKKLLEELGGDFAQGKYLACAWHREASSGSFVVSNDEQRKRKTYTLKVL
jgi:hypothetical protein